MTMTVVLAGLTDSSARAIENLAASVIPDAVLVKQSRDQALRPPPPGAGAAGAPAPAADICIVDLGGLGFTQWSQTRHAQLQEQVLGTRRALLLAPEGSGGGWLGALKPSLGPRRMVLQKPLTATALRNALATMCDAARPRQGAPLHALPDAVPGAERAGLPASSFARLQAVCPGTADNAYLNLVAGLAARPCPHEFGIGSHSGMVVHPAEGWVASNISAAMCERLIQHPAMQGIVQVTPLEEYDTTLRAQRLFGRRRDGRRPLDEFLWALAYKTLSRSRLALAGDLQLHLQHFPNFTRLPAVPDLFIQLALVCQRGAMPLTTLLKTFARHDPDLVMLFVACAVLSGYATASPVTDAPVRPVPAAPDRPQPSRGFLRALLSKLF